MIRRKIPGEGKLRLYRCPAVAVGPVGSFSTLPHRAPTLPHVAPRCPHITLWCPHIAPRCPTVPPHCPTVAHGPHTLPHGAPRCFTVPHDAPRCPTLPHSTPRCPIRLFVDVSKKYPDSISVSLLSSTQHGKGTFHRNVCCNAVDCHTMHKKIQNGLTFIILPLNYT